MLLKFVQPLENLHTTSEGHPGGHIFSFKSTNRFKNIYTIILIFCIHLKDGRKWQWDAIPTSTFLLVKKIRRNQKPTAQPQLTSKDTTTHCRYRHTRSLFFTAFSCWGNFAMPDQHPGLSHTHLTQEGIISDKAGPQLSLLAALDFQLPKSWCHGTSPCKTMTFAGLWRKKPSPTLKRYRWQEKCWCALLLKWQKALNTHYDMVPL